MPRLVRQHARVVQFPLIPLAAAFLVALAGPRSAAQTWTGGGADNAWENGANWAGGVAPANGSTTDVFLSGTTRLNPTASAGLTLRSLNFGADAGAFALSGTTLALGSGGLSNFSPSAHQVNANVTLNNSQTWSVSGGDVLVNGNVSWGSLGQVTFGGSARTTINGSLTANNTTITKNGTGELVLGGTQANALSFVAFTAASGVLTLAKPAGVNAVSNNFTIGSGDTAPALVRWAAAEQVPDDATVTVRSTGTLDLGGFGERLGVLQLWGGRITNGTVTLGGSATASGTGSRLEAALDLANAVRTVSIGGSEDVTVTGPVRNGGIDLRGGGKLVLAGANTFAGGVTLSGEVVLGSDTALGTGPLTISGQYGTPKVTTLPGAPRVITNALDVRTGFTVGGASDLEFTSTMQIGGNVIIVTSGGGGITTFSGGISSSGLPAGLVLQGSGTLNLKGVNALADVTVSNGTLAVGGDAALGTATVTLGSGTIRADAAPRVIANAVRITTNPGVAGNHDLTLAGPVALEGVVATPSILTVSNTASTVISGTISSAATTRLHGLTKAGAGTLAFAGGGSNTYLGSTTVTAGTLLLNKDAAAVAVAGPLVVGDGAGGANADVVRWQAAGQLAAGSTVAVASSGLLDLAGFSAAVAGLDVRGGNVTTGGGTLTLNGSLTSTGGNLSGSLDLGGGVRTFNVGNASATLTVAGGLSNGGIAKTGAGTLLLLQPGTFAGGITLSAGTLILPADGVTGTGTVALAGGILRGTGGPRTIDNPLLVTADVTVSNSTDLTFTGAAAVAGQRTLNVGTGLRVSLAGPLSDAVAGEPSGLSLTGVGTVELRGANAFTGQLVAGGGVVAFGHDAAAGSGTIRFTGGSVRADGGPRAMANPVVLDANLVVGGTNDLAFAGPVSLTASRTITADNAGVTALDGAISETAAGRSLNKAGGGVLRLSGDNTFTGGVTLSAGTLAVANDRAAGTGTLTWTGGVLRAEGGARTMPNAVALGGNVTFAGAHDLTLVGTVTLTGGNRTLTVDGPGRLSIAGAVGQDLGGRVLTKQGAGVLVLAGAAPATYSGGATVAAGTLVLAKAQGAAGVSGLLAVGDGAGGPAADVVRLAAHNQLAATSQVAVLASGLLDLDGFSSATGSLALTAGAVTTGAGTLTITNGALTASFSTSPAGSTVAGRLSASNQQLLLTVDDGAAPVDLDVSATVLDGTLRKIGFGTLRLSGANTHSGGLVLAGGTTLLANDQAAGTGPIRAESGTLQADGGPRTLANELVLAGSLTIDGPHDLTLTGGITGTNAFTKNGAGRLVLPPSTTMAHGLLLNAGQVVAADLTVASNSNITANGGSFVGAVTNRGTVQLRGVNVTGPFTNHNVVSVIGPVTLAAGAVNTASFNVNASGALSVDGPGLRNTGTLGLTAFTGTVGGSGPLVNDSLITGTGAWVGTGGFTNNGTLRATGGNLALAGGGPTANFGTIDLGLGAGLELRGVSLDNQGLVDLGGGSLTGTGSVANSAKGTIDGPGLVNVPLTNAGTVAVSGGLLRIAAAFTNQGLITLGGGTAELGGGAIANVGTLQGVGRVSSDVTNRGLIGPTGGTLVLSGAVTNAADGLIVSSGSSKVLVLAGMPVNAGVINLGGGAFDNNGLPMTNAGQVSGYGTLRTGGLDNDGVVVLTGGPSTVNGPVTNRAGRTISVLHNPALFTGAVVNHGTLAVTGATATFAGGLGGGGGVTGNGSITIAAGASASADAVHQAGLTVGGTLTLRTTAAGAPSVSTVRALDVPAGGTLDLGGNALVVDYEGPSPLATLVDRLARGFNGGDWKGAGTRSAAAAADRRGAVGVATAADVFGAGGGTFLGTPVDGSAVLLRYTLAGDATLDGAVDFDDLLKLAQNYNVTDGSRTWSQGDYTYDGNVDFDDLLKLAQNYNRLLAAAVDLPAAASPALADDWAAALAAVPEPSTLVAGGAVAAYLALRRRLPR